MAMAVSSQKSRDAALLRATTELYLLEAEHDADEMRRFEELATHFLGKVTVGDRAFVAERLARHPDAPASVLRMLAKDILEVASPVLRHATTLSSFDWIAILAATGTPHARLIAKRNDLSADIITALRLIDDDEIRASLPPQTEAEMVMAIELDLQASFSPEPQPGPAELPAIAAAKVLTVALSAELDALLDEIQPKPKAEIALPARASTPSQIAIGETAVPAKPVAAMPELPGAHQFLGLDRDARLAMLERFATLPEPPRGHPSPLELDRAFHAAVNRAKVPALARQRQRDALIETMAAGLDLKIETVQAFVDDASGEALVVLLKAIGLTDIEAQQVLLLANPEIGEAVGSFFRLVKLFARLDRAAADHMVRQWREEARSRPTAPAHVPHYAPSDNAARAARPTAIFRPLAEDVPERTTFGKRGA